MNRHGHSDHSMAWWRYLTSSHRPGGVHAGLCPSYRLHRRSASGRSRRQRWTTGGIPRLPAQLAAQAGALMPRLGDADRPGGEIRVRLATRAPGQILAPLAAGLLLRRRFAPGGTACGDLRTRLDGCAPAPAFAASGPLSGQQPAATASESDRRSVSHRRSIFILLDCCARRHNGTSIGKGRGCGLSPILTTASAGGVIGLAAGDVAGGAGWSRERCALFRVNA
jgi:hypothetical protein